MLNQTLPNEGNWLRIRWWEYVITFAVITFAALYALPSWFPSQPALQISANTANTKVDNSLVTRVERLLENQEISFNSGKLIAANNRNLVQVTFTDTKNQLRARTIITKALGRNYVTALNNTPTIPQWLESLGGRSISLGLDLQGGVHFLLQVDTQQVLNQRLEAIENEARKILRSNGIGFVSMESEISPPQTELVNSLRISFLSAGDATRGREAINDEIGGYYQLTNADDTNVLVTIPNNSIKEIESAAVEQNLISLRNRVNELGVSEPLVQRQGRNRIVVELPGVKDTTQAKRVIGATANLEFRLEAKSNAPRDETIALGFRDEPSRRAQLEKEIIVTGSNVIDANSGFDENGRPQVNIELDSTGGSQMGDVTLNAIGRRMGAVFIEYKNQQKTNDKGEITTSRFIEKSIISLATIEGAFANRFRITGLRDQFESAELALLLRAGSLAAPVYFVEERTVGASLGEENIRLGTISLIIGLCLVAVFMLAIHRLCGLFAIAALLINTLVIIAALATLSATLTLPGIAGLVLNLGMVVDANVLIFSRIKQELNNGISVPLALERGFSRAVSTILDANITTLLVAIILFAIGTGPIRGFAITLSLGIIGSLICSILMVRFILKLTLGKRKQLGWIHI